MMQPLVSDRPVDATTPFSEVAERWLAEEVKPQLRGGYDTYRIYALTHFAPFFKVLGNFTSRQCASYGSHRLSKVQRDTVQKELSALRWLGQWCEREGLVDAAPEVPPLRRAARGRVNKPRAARSGIDVHEAAKIIEALPDFSRSKRVAPFAIRNRFIVALETGLRPSTLNQIEAPLDYQRGSKTLRIRDEIDKNRYGRDLPLSDRARAALDAVCPDRGLIFGKHDYREAWSEACAAVLPEEQAKTVTIYDLRRARLTELSETGNLPGAAYLAGHRQITTINKYAQPNLKAAQRAMSASEERRRAQQPEAEPEPSTLRSGVIATAPEPPPVAAAPPPAAALPPNFGDALKAFSVLGRPATDAPRPDWKPLTGRDMKRAFWKRRLTAAARRQRAHQPTPQIAKAPTPESAPVWCEGEDIKHQWS
jgi:integrase